jgi:hypothetical protein
MLGVKLKFHNLGSGLAMKKRIIPALDPDVDLQSGSKRGKHPNRHFTSASSDERHGLTLSGWSRDTMESEVAAGGKIQDSAC